MTFTTSDGTNAVPLGKIRDVPVRFREITITVPIVVVDSTTYDMILGNEWLEKARAVLDIFGEVAEEFVQIRLYECLGSVLNDSKSSKHKDHPNIEEKEFTQNCSLDVLPQSR